MPSTITTQPQHREMLRRATIARRMIKRQQIEGWKALDLITAPAAILEQRCQALDIELHPQRRVG